MPFRHSFIHSLLWSSLPIVGISRVREGQRTRKITARTKIQSTTTFLDQRCQRLVRQIQARSTEAKSTGRIAQSGPVPSGRTRGQCARVLTDVQLPGRLPNESGPQMLGVVVVTSVP